MSDQIRTAIKALAALLDRDISFMGNVAQLPFESHDQAFNHVYEARRLSRDAITAMEQIDSEAT